MRVLLVEEDLQIGESLLRALKVADCSVDWVRDGKAGSVAINTAYYAVVLLDPGLSGAGGIDLLRALRAAGNDVPVLILTALDDLETRVHSLDVGADDCVLKPIEVRELLARIRAVLRRKAGYATSRIGGESLSLDLDKRMLRCNGVAHPFKREVERAFCKLRMLRLSMMIEPFRHALAA
jgi:two-component system, OmpR family, response regulator